MEKMSKEVVLSLRGRVRIKEDDFSFIFVFNHPTLFLTGIIFNFPLVKSIFSCEIILQRRHVREQLGGHLEFSHGHPITVSEV